MIRRWLALTYYLYALRLAALSHFYFNRLYKVYATYEDGVVVPFDGSESAKGYQPSILIK